MEEPFDTMPPSGQLPMIPKACVYRYATTSLKSNPPKRNDHNRLSPSQELDRYLAAYPRFAPPPSTAPASAEDVFASIPSEIGSTSLDTVSSSESRQSELEMRLSQAESQLQSCTQLLETCLVAHDGNGDMVRGGLGLGSEGYDDRPCSTLLNGIEDCIGRKGLEVEAQSVGWSGTLHQNHKCRKGDELKQRIDSFQQETRRLMAENIHRSWTAPKVGDSLMMGEETRFAPPTNFLSSSVIGLPVRHTLKSAAAAHARLSGSCKNSLRPESINSNPSFPRKDHLSLLMADVSALKTKIASNLAELETWMDCEDTST